MAETITVVVVEAEVLAEVAAEAPSRAGGSSLAAMTIVFLSVVDVVMVDVVVLSVVVLNGVVVKMAVVKMVNSGLHMCHTRELPNPFGIATVQIMLT